MAPIHGMRPFGDVISLDAARAILDTTGSPIARIETVPLDEANGRVLARDVIARRDVPPFSRAGMDGYAVARATRAEHRAIGAAHAGERSERYTPARSPPIPVRDGECIEISTGAPMPDGADAVIMVEETDADATARSAMFAEVQPEQNVGRRGADIRTGQVVVASGETSTRAASARSRRSAPSWVDVYAPAARGDSLDGQ